MLAREWIRACQDAPQKLEIFLQNTLQFIESHNDRLQACEWLAPWVQIQKRCQELQKVSAPEDLRLFGLPVLIKANISKTDYPVTCSSRILEGYRGLFDATVVERLEKAGAIILGITTQDEFAMGNTGQKGAFQKVIHPWDEARVPGGSSGGSAVACAVNFAPITLGSDTGGSVRLPASYCGVYGFCPSYGRLSRHGLVAYGSSLDRIGIFSKSVSDLELVLSVVAGADHRDQTTFSDSYESLPSNWRPRAIGLMKTDLDPEKDFHRDQIYDLIKQLGIRESLKVEDLFFHRLDRILSVYYVLACAEASSNLSRFDGFRYGSATAGKGSYRDVMKKTRGEKFGREVKLRILMGACALSHFYHDNLYGRALELREELRGIFLELFGSYDLICLPTSTTIAPLEKEKLSPLQNYRNDVYTVFASLCGLPALSVPLKTDGLPRGLQIVGTAGADQKVMAFASFLEREGLIAPYQKEGRYERDALSDL